MVSHLEDALLESSLLVHCVEVKALQEASLGSGLRILGGCEASPKVRARLRKQCIVVKMDIAR
jgi:hypothetical protein